jgi:hypothetical protein
MLKRSWLKLTWPTTDERYMPLPAETGPVLAPDRLSVCPVEGGRYGLVPPTTARRASSEPKHSDETSRPRISRRPSVRSWAMTGRCDSGL